MHKYPNLRSIREKFRLKQVDVAVILHTSQQQYSKYENGTQEIPAHHLITLAMHYGTTVDYLLGLKDQP